MNIYLDIDGTLIHEDLALPKAAAGLADFIHVLRPHNTFWLTTHCRDGNPELARSILKQYVPEDLHGDIDRIQPTVWDTLKTEGMDWSQDFIWLDNDICEVERRRFATALSAQSFIEINLRQNPNHLIEITRDILG